MLIFALRNTTCYLHDELEDIHKYKTVYFRNCWEQPTQHSRVVLSACFDGVEEEKKKKQEINLTRLMTLQKV